MLHAASELTVREAQAGDRLEAGTVYIAPGDFHMLLESVDGYDFIKLNKNPLENSCRPSADPLFRSAAAIHGFGCLGVVMTGMGQDGPRGSEVLYAAGATILVQDYEYGVQPVQRGRNPVPHRHGHRRVLSRVAAAYLHTGR